MDTFNLKKYISEKKIYKKESNLRESIEESFTKEDWDGEWKLPKDNLFNVSKSKDAVTSRFNAIQDLLKSYPQELQKFDNDDNHPATNMSYDELMSWLGSLKTEESKLNEGENPNRMLKLIQMYVDNYSDEGMDAEALIEKIGELFQGNLDDYDKSFMGGEEDQY